MDLIGKVIGTDLQICGRSILVYLSLLEVPVVTIPGHLTLYSHVPASSACKTGGFQENKFNYFNDLQKLWCQFIRLSIRAGTGKEPFKTRAYTGERVRLLVVC